MLHSCSLLRYFTDALRQKYTDVTLTLLHKLCISTTSVALLWCHGYRQVIKFTYCLPWADLSCMISKYVLFSFFLIMDGRNPEGKKIRI